MTVTTVGYGDVIGKSISEIIFQIIMVFAGTCIYSWLITSVSNYVKKMNEKNIKYEEKIQVLEEIKLSCHVNEKLYNKILRLLNYRKYHEEESEKNIILESLPNSLKNTLIIEMYKAYINGFSFFKDIENKVLLELRAIF
jgi:predicted solute-binding protein